MKKLFLIAFAILNILYSFGQTSGELSVNVSTSQFGGRYAPRHIVAIWVEDESGNFVKTLVAYAQRYITHLNTWEASTNNAGSMYDRTDATTGATRNTHSPISTLWDGTNFTGSDVPDGNYRVCMELTDQNATGNYSYFNFTKGVVRQELFPANVPSFSSISIIWAPDIVLNTPPTATITSPANFTTLQGESLNVQVSASDMDGTVSLVNFYIDDIFVGSDNSFPFSLELSGLLSGSHTLSVIAVDNLNAVSQAAAIQFTASCNSQYTLSGETIGTDGSRFNMGNDKFKATDGDVNTYFDSPNSGNDWVGFNFGSAKTIVGFEFYPRSGYESTMNGARLQVANSSDFSDSVSIYTFAGISELNWHCVYISLPSDYQYVRLISSSNQRCNVAEIKCYTNLPQLPVSNGNGLSAIYFNDENLQEYAFATINEAVNFNWGYSSPDSRIFNNYSVMWQGQIQAPATGEYTFTLTSGSKVRMWINDEFVVDDWNNSPATEFNYVVSLNEGQFYPIRIEMAVTGESANIAFEWTPPGYTKQIVGLGWLSSQVRQTLALHNGWNLVSFYSLPDDKSVVSVFSNLPVVVKDEESVYENGIPSYLNSLQFVEFGKGYYVYLNSQIPVVQQIEILGEPNMEPSVDFSSCPAGWSILGLGSYSIQSATFPQDVKTIKDFNYFWNGTMLSNLTELQNGKAYLIQK